MTTFSDNFDRPDSTNLGSNWVEVSGDWSIVSNQLSPGASGSTVVLRAAVTATTNDNFAQATIAATTAVSQGVWCRGNNDITSGYLLRNNGTQWDLFSVVGGTFTSIGTYVAAVAAGDVIKVQASGSTIQGFVNGVQRISVTNTAVTSGVNSGIRCQSTSSLRWDNFSSGDVSVIATLGVSSSTETAQPISGEKTASLPSEVETDDSPTVIGSKISVLGPADSSEDSQQITGEKSVTVSEAFEQDSSPGFSGELSGSLGQSESAESTQSVSGGKTASLEPALETSEAKSIGKEVVNVADSILTNIKKIVGIPESDTSFDPDIIMHTNTVFSVLNQLGIGPSAGFMIMDATATWDDFLKVQQVKLDGANVYTDEQLQEANKQLNMVKTYVYLRVRLLFDPPQTSFVIESIDKQIQELEVRMSIVREGISWVDPMAATVTSSTNWWD